MEKTQLYLKSYLKSKKSCVFPQETLRLHTKALK